jgi:threonine synthase
LKEPDWAMAGAAAPVTVPPDADAVARELGLAERA